MVHVLSWAVTLAVIGQAGRAAAWAWRRFWLWRAPMLPSMEAALRWSRQHRGRLARYPKGHVSLDATGAEQVLTIRERRR